MSPAWVLFTGVVSGVFGWNLGVFWKREKKYWDAYRDGWNDCLYTIELKKRWPMTNVAKRQPVVPHDLFKRDDDAG